MEGTAVRLVWLMTVLGVALGGMYNEFVTELTAANFDAEVMNSAETWVVKFMAPWCGHCRNSAPSFSRAAKRLYGVVRLGVVDCDAHGALAQRYGVQGFPSFKTFSGVGKRARRPSDYNGDRSASAIAAHARYIQPSFVARVMPKGTDSFFRDLAKLPHVLLFTDKTETSGLYKGMSARYHKRIAFGEVRIKDGKETAEQYEVDKFPTVLVFPPGVGEKDKATKYAGKMDPKSLITYFDTLAKDGAEAAGEGEPAGEEKKVFSQPKAYNGEVEAIGSKAEYMAKCGARSDGRMCILGLLPGGVDHELKQDLAEAAKRYMYDNIAFAIIDRNDKHGGGEYAKVFDGAHFAAIRARKNKYSAMNADVELTIAGVTAFVDRVVGGEVRYAKMDDLPEWTPPKTDEAEHGTNEANKTDDANDEGTCSTKPKDGATCGKPKDEL